MDYGYVQHGNGKMKCPKCGSKVLVLFTGQLHGLSNKELEKAIKQSKNGKIYGFKCLNCRYTKTSNNPIRKKEG